MEYNWNGEGFTDSDAYSVGSDFTDSLSLQVRATDSDGNQYTITPEALNFIWQAEEIDQSDVYLKGQKGAIVEMFGWPHEDIKQECEYLA